MVLKKSKKLQSDKGRLEKFLDETFRLFVFCCPMMLCLAAYNQLGHYISGSRPHVRAKVTNVHYSQGKHHVTNATIEFPSSYDSNHMCMITTWFRGSDSGIYNGAEINIVHAQQDCGTPWFPDHIPATSEELWISLFTAALAGGIFVLRREVRKQESMPTLPLYNTVSPDTTVADGDP